MSKNPFVNVIVPVYNEAERIETSARTLLSYLRESAFPYPYAVTIVDNGSTDGTDVCVAGLMQEHPDVVRVISLQEKGKGRAVQRGWQEEGDILAFMDADLSSDLEFFRPLIDSIAHGGYDLATGNRLGKTSQIYGRKFVRGLLSRGYNALIRILFGSRLRDHQCGFKAIRKDAYQRIAPLIQDTGWFFDTELLVIAARHGYRINSIDIRWRDDSRSKVSVLKTPIDMLRAIYRFRMRLWTGQRSK